MSRSNQTSRRWPGPRATRYGAGGLLSAALWLGLLLGVRHALDPDHLAAVSTLVADRPGPRAGAVLGACWGLGHSVALLAVGCLLGALGDEMPGALAGVFELLVGVMLTVLGARAVLSAHRTGGVGPVTTHRHGRGVPLRAHTHGAVPSDVHVHVGRWTLARRPLIVGMIHGLAGSGALTALVLTRLPTLGARLIYTLVFGLGSVAGMASLSGLAGWPLERLARSAAPARGLATVTGLVSAALGLWWGWSAARGLLGA